MIRTQSLALHHCAGGLVIHVSFALVLTGRTLVTFADSLEECVRRLLIRIEAMEKGLMVNAGKTKVMIYGTGLDILQSSCEYPCTFCRTGEDNASIYCNGVQEMQRATTTDTKSLL